MWFPAGDRTEGTEYHRSIDADVVMTWCKEQKIVVTLDHAAYHRGTDDDLKTSLKATKAYSIAFLRALGG